LIVRHGEFFHFERFEVIHMPPVKLKILGRKVKK
jgi:hypothetical protein